MEAVQVNQTEVIPANSFDVSLFDSFIAFIDRGERTTQTYLTNLRQFAAWMKYAAVERPTRHDILSYRDYLGSAHDAIRLDPGAAAGYSYRTDKRGNHIIIICKPNTVAQYLRSVCQFFKWTAAAGLYPDVAANVHAPKISHETHRKEALTAADVLNIENSIVNHADKKEQAAGDCRKDTAGRMERATEQGKRLYAMYELAVNAGLRTVELSRANVKDLEVINGTAILYIWGKGHSEPDQRKPLAPEVYNAVKDYLDSRADKPTATSPLFVATGNRSGGRRIAARTISQMLKKAMREAGYNSERITAHSLRHTAGTNVMNLCGNVYTTQKYMRHSNPATTEIYLHTDTEKQEISIAQDLYNLYHNRQSNSGREKLQGILATMTPAQIEQLTGIAAAIAR